MVLKAAGVSEGYSLIQVGSSQQANRQQHLGENSMFLLINVLQTTLPQLISCYGKGLGDPCKFHQNYTCVNVVYCHVTCVQTMLQED